MSSPPVVAIDGPSGSGKSTTARGVGSRLGLPVLDTGAMYRAVTLAVLEADIDPSDPGIQERVADIARESAIVLEGGSTHLGGRDVSAEIRGPAVTSAVSAVAANAAVREVLVARQRAWVDEHGGGVVEGRDIGTVVFPHAQVKVHLVARDDERARRRQQEEVSARREVHVDDVRESIAERDRKDSTRAVSPLRVADDAMVIDTSTRTVDDVVDEIVARFESAEAGEDL